VNVARCEVGTLELGAGLEVLVSAALQSAGEAGLDVISESRSSAAELLGWARLAGHPVIEERTEGSRWIVRLRRGPDPQVSGAQILARAQPDLSRGEFTTNALRELVGPPPPYAEPSVGLAPLGSHAEPLAHPYNWAHSEKDRLWSEHLATLTDRAAAAQWNATTDVPWQTALLVRGDRQRAVSQVATYIAQNEYAAYYVPAQYLSQVNPSFVEVLMWLASHVHDEARHIEVFTKRALIGDGPARALASTELSLRTLMEEHDFSVSALLLNVLGEGTFLDLLAFVAAHAPDAAMATAARLAHRDERRHVQFGISHIRSRLDDHPDERAPLVAAVERRAAKLVNLEGLSPVVGESLVVMASPSMQPADIGDSGRAVRAMLGRMARNREARLRAAGFDDSTARYLSELHTPNLM
jgi:hypothetical protein